MHRVQIPLLEYDNELSRLAPLAEVRRVLSSIMIGALYKFVIGFDGWLLNRTALSHHRRRARCEVVFNLEEYLYLVKLQKEIRRQRLSRIDPRPDNVLQSVLAKQISEYCQVPPDQVIYEGVFEKLYFSRFMEDAIADNQESHAKPLKESFDAVLNKKSPRRLAPGLNGYTRLPEGIERSSSYRVALWNLNQNLKKTEPEGVLDPELQAFLLM